MQAPKFPMNRNEWMRQFGPKHHGLFITEEDHKAWEVGRSGKPTAAVTRPVRAPMMECQDPEVYCKKEKDDSGIVYPRIYRGDELILTESPTLHMWFIDRKPLTLKQKDCAPYFHLIREGLTFREIPGDTK